ncbi:uncharacterized protein LOC134829897 [Culicoides brevitarsis]|uniref:uncharacterized protein LOC134829897 n=1 Tax=Culicoides brevitarsis TaxID=469753 RepID=UPI00307C45A9
MCLGKLINSALACQLVWVSVSNEMNGATNGSNSKLLTDFESKDILWQAKENGKPLVLLLDYDGTLAVIQPNPNNTRMTEDTKKILEEICSNKDVFVSIITGRCVKDIKEKVGIESIIYAGNHGFEITYPNGETHNQPISEEHAESYKNILAELEPLAKNGAWIEDKIFSMTFHYEETPEELHSELDQKAREIIKKHGFKPTGGHLIVETRPPILWHKGYAAKYLLQRHFGDDWREKVNVVFMGDDTSDEDIMKALNGHAITFRVSQNPELVTDATFLIKSPSEVNTILHKIKESLAQNS